MKLGFIGSGSVGGTLARRLGKLGHKVHLGTRHASHTSEESNESPPHKLRQEIGANAEVLSIKDCIQKSEVIFLATPWSAVAEVVRDHAQALAGKVLIDCTNPLKPALSGLESPENLSGGEYLQQSLPKTKVVKAFNTVGFNIMENPIIRGQRSLMYYCGNDESARQTVRELIEAMDFMPIDAGLIHNSGLLESQALLWIKSAYQFGLGREFAYALLIRADATTKIHN